MSCLWFAITRWRHPFTADICQRERMMQLEIWLSFFQPWTDHPPRQAHTISIIITRMFYRYPMFWGFLFKLKLQHLCPEKLTFISSSNFIVFLMWDQGMDSSCTVIHISPLGECIVCTLISPPLPFCNFGTWSWYWLIWFMIFSLALSTRENSSGFGFSCLSVQCYCCFPCQCWFCVVCRSHQDVLKSEYVQIQGQRNVDNISYGRRRKTRKCEELLTN